MRKTRVLNILGAATAAVALLAISATPAAAQPSPPDFDPEPPALTSDGVLLDAPDPGIKAFAPATDLENYPKGMPHPSPFSSLAAEPVSHEDVVVETDLGDVTDVKLFHPTLGTSGEELAEQLRAAGLDAHVVSHGPDIGDDTVQLMASPNGCTVGTAATLRLDVCPVPIHHTNNGFPDPQVRFNDHSSAAWPVTRAVVDWNTAVGIDSYYLNNSCPFLAGSRCVDVYSADYGDTGWDDLVNYRFDNATHSFTENSIYVQLNDNSNLTAVQRRRVAAHGLGHSLGLGHASTVASVMVGVPAGATITTGSSDDFAFLANLYSVTR